MSIAEKTTFDRRLALGSVFLIANAIVWYFLVATTLEQIISKATTNQFETLLIWSAHFAAFAFSLVAGTFLIKKINRKNLFFAWTLLGVISPIGLLVFNITQTSVVLVMSVLFAISLGLGMPNCMEYFTRSTSTERRGHFGGLILLITGVGLFVVGMTNTGSIALSALILILWRLFGLLVTVSAKPFNTDNKKLKQEISYWSVLSNRSFLFYFIPWIMFSLVNELSTPIQSTILGQSDIKLLIIIEDVLIGIFAIVGGHLVDYIGRKRTAVVGFVLLGLGFSVLGFYPKEMASWFFYTAVDGVAWGILFVVFITTIWGELVPNASSDKFYALGLFPFFGSKLLQLAFGNQIAESVSPYSLFSFIAFFLFLAVLPLVYAPETLPEKISKARELQNYVKKALEKTQKEPEKKHREKGEDNSKEVSKTKEESSDGNSKEYDEAVKLAEKYY